MQILNSKSFRAYGSHDILGVELAGALKNVMAIAAGIIHGIGYGANTRSFLISRGLSELTRVGQLFNIQPQTVSGLAGVGDLVVTCNSEQSRNFRMGIALARGSSVEQAQDQMQQVVEGIRTTQSAYELTRTLPESFPIIETMHAIIYNQLDLQTAEQQLLV
ncbi:MAG: NAD(P)H-dependent glycerol-3-phosphate dehydrogenase, partial [Myxococcota bacterium]